MNCRAEGYSGGSVGRPWSAHLLLGNGRFAAKRGDAREIGGVLVGWEGEKKKQKYNVRSGPVESNLNLNLNHGRRTGLIEGDGCGSASWRAENCVWVCRSTCWISSSAWLPVQAGFAGAGSRAMLPSRLDGYVVSAVDSGCNLNLSSVFSFGRRWVKSLR